MNSQARQDRAGFHITATPYLCIRDAASAIAYYQQAFGATEVARMTDDTGKIGHAEIMIGAARIMLADEFPEINVLSPQTLGGSSVTIVLHVPDVDALVSQAVAAGATLLRNVTDEPHGRTGKVADPFGHTWILVTPLG